MSIQTRTTALQNEVVRLYCHFNQNGQLYNPSSQPLVEILDSDGVTILDTIQSQVENQGILYVDWFVPANLPLGQYYDRWTYQWDPSLSVQEQTMIFSVYSLSSYINFLSQGVATNISSRTNQLLMDLSNDFIYESMHIPIYFEQGMRIQQDNQQKRVKKYYYFTINDNEHQAYEGDQYLNNGQKFTVFATLPFHEYSSSSSSSSSSIDFSSSSIDSSSSSDSSESSSSSNGHSTSSSSQTEMSSSSSSTTEELVTTTTTPYVRKIILTCVGTGDPLPSGTLALISGDGDQSIPYTEFESKQSTFSTVYSFAYEHWNQQPRPIVRVNNRVVDDGWHADYMGKIYFDSFKAPEDSVSCAYNFSYFSQEELLSFLNFGLKMMNGLPPASEAYRSLDMSPPVWDAGIILYAAILALKRLIFGLTWQEKKIIYGRPEDAQNAASLYQDLYKSYMEMWTEFGKNVKTRKLPGIALTIQPEFSLPGGRCLSSSTYISSLVNKVECYVTVKELYKEFSEGNDVSVLSYVDGEFIYSNVSKIWESGEKLTYVVSDGVNELRLSEEHIVFTTNRGYICVKDLALDDYLLINNNWVPESRKLIGKPIVYEVESVFDIEVPTAQNFVGNNIVSHNSRWFRYMFKMN